MNLTKIFKYTFLAGLMAAFSGCSSDEPLDSGLGNEGTSDVEAGYYLSLNINFPSTAVSGRSTTNGSGNSEHGTLDAFESENTIKSAALYFFDNTDDSKSKGKLLCYFSSSSSSGLEVGTVTTKDNIVTCKLTQKVEAKDLIAIFGKKLHIFAIINNSKVPTVTTYASNATSATQESNFLNFSFATTENNNIFPRSFKKGFSSEGVPMSNYDYYTLDLTEIRDFTEDNVMQEAARLFNEKKGDGAMLWDISKYNESKSIKGNLDIERSIARIDYKAGQTDNVYKLAQHTMSLKNGDSSTPADVYLKVVSMQLFNVNSSSYFFRQAVDGDNSKATYNNAFILVPFGKENGGESGKYNWIADPKWDTKQTTTVTEGSFSSPESLGYLFPSLGSGTTWNLAKNDSYIKLEDINTWLNDRNNTEAKKITGGYYPWYYITENTVPSKSKMTIPFCTGIEFKMQLCKKVNNNEYIALTQDDSADETNKSIRILRTSDSYYQDTYYSEAVNDGDPAGYYLTYKFLIPHNYASGSSVNGNTGVDGNNTESLQPMQIGVVRNNVYQLSLTNIKNLPDPHEPDNFNMVVNISVLAWTKRDISVTF